MTTKSPSWASHTVTLNSPHFPSSVTLKLQIKEKFDYIKSDPWSFQIRVKRHSRSREAQMYLTPEAWVICHLHDY